MNTHRHSTWLGNLLFVLPILIALLGFSMAHAAGTPVQELPQVVVNGKRLASDANKLTKPLHTLPQVVVSGKSLPSTLAMACVATATKVC